jgi:hypothetical protein
MSARIVYHLNQMNRGGPISRNISNYSNIITILVESCALYAINSILFIGTYGAGHDASTIFLPLLSQTQVRRPTFAANIIELMELLGDCTIPYHITRCYESISDQHYRYN